MFNFAMSDRLNNLLGEKPFTVNLSRNIIVNKCRHHYTVCYKKCAFLRFENDGTTQIDLRLIKTALSTKTVIKYLNMFVRKAQFFVDGDSIKFRTMHGTERTVDMKGLTRI